MRVGNTLESRSWWIPGVIWVDRNILNQSRFVYGFQYKHHDGQMPFQITCLPSPVWPTHFSCTLGQKVAVCYQSDVNMTFWSRFVYQKWYLAIKPMSWVHRPSISLNNGGRKISYHGDAWLPPYVIVVLYIFGEFLFKIVLGRLLNFFND